MAGISCIAVGLVPSASHAQEIVKFDIKEQPLGKALTEFARQSQIQLLFSPDLVVGKTSNFVQGDLSPIDALNALMIDSNLTITLTSDDTVLIQKAEMTLPNTKRVNEPNNAPVQKKTEVIPTTQYAQLDESQPVVQVDEREQTPSERIVVNPVDDEDIDTIVTTGTRIKRDNYSSIQPIQIIDAEVSRDLGLFDSTRILQQSQAASGQQIDQTLQTGLLDNGPGSSTINLRGLGADRTLLLMNGRRLAPSGVEGAPSAPSVNQLPSGMVERYDVLLDGASAVYGSDAIGGVVNVILKKDFDGFEFTASGQAPTSFDTTDYAGTLTWGKNSDRGFIGIGAEFQHVDEVKISDRKFLRGCTTNVEVTESGEIRRLDIRDQVSFGLLYDGFEAADPSECVVGTGVSRLQQNGQLGSIFAARGGGTASNIGIPGFFDTNFRGIPIDADGDGIQDVNRATFSEFDADESFSLSPEQDRISLMSYGEYTLEGDSNLTPFFEILYSNTKVNSDTVSPPLIADVGANNPFNPCGINGVDCNQAILDVVSDPGYIARWQSYFTDPDPNRDGVLDEGFARRTCLALNILFEACTPQNPVFGLGFLPSGPQPSVSIVSVRGDRDNYEAEFDNLRLTAGLKGDLPWLNAGDVNGWTFEASLTHSESNATSVRRGVRADRLAFAIGNDPNDFNVNGFFGSRQLPGGACDANGSVDVIRPDVLAGCVPVNLFADSLYAGVANADFATQAERDYLFDERVFKTVYKQTLFNAYATGNIAKLPAGTVAGVLGLEVRKDNLESVPDEVGALGLLSNVTPDLGATGDKTTAELFAEVDVPVFKDAPLFYSLDLNLSGRLTDDEFYGVNKTYSVKTGWRPIPKLLLKATYGTSFRAPNLRENFFDGQEVSQPLRDPCIVPNEARQFDPNSGGFIYNEAGDLRDPLILAACEALGADPTLVGLSDPNSAFFLQGIESTGGSLDLEPETSKSLTLGWAYEDSIPNIFDFRLGMSYFDVKVNNATVQPNANSIIGQCIRDTSVGAISPFCDRITRDVDTGVISRVDSRFINRDSERVRGLDYNAGIGKQTTVFKKPLDLSFDVSVSQMLERSSRFLNAQGEAAEQDLAKLYYFPEFTGDFSLAARFDDKWTARVRTRYIDSMDIQEELRPEFGDALGTTTREFEVPGFGAFTAPVIADTCGGPAVGDELCRWKSRAEDYFETTVSLRYDADTWSATLGIANLFDQAPPEVDPTIGAAGVAQVSNVPVGVGYDLLGRNFFATVSKKF